MLQENISNQTFQARKNDIILSIVNQKRFQERIKGTGLTTLSMQLR